MFKQMKNVLMVFVMEAVMVLGGTVPAMADRPADMRKAAKGGDLATVQAFIAKGYDVNAKDNSGFTALMIASLNGHRDVVQTLITADADINAESNDGLTALMVASTAEVVQALITAGADVNAKDKIGFTALIWASFTGHRDVVQALITAGADVNAKANDGLTALWPPPRTPTWRATGRRW